MKETIYNIEKKNMGEMELPGEIFTEKVNKALVYEIVKMQLANRREGSAATRNRKLVSGTTAKMYRQKGTGRARHGDARANIFVGGGKAFGPHPRDYSYRLPKSARKGALKAALSLKKSIGKFIVLDEFKMPKIKTAEAVKIFSKLGVKSALIVVDDVVDTLFKSVRNIPNMKLVKTTGLNVYDLMKHEHTIITVPALNKIGEVL